MSITITGTSRTFRSGESFKPEKILEQVRSKAGAEAVRGTLAWARTMQKAFGLKAKSIMEDERITDVAKQRDLAEARSALLEEVERKRLLAAQVATSQVALTEVVEEGRRASAPKPPRIDLDKVPESDRESTRAMLHLIKEQRSTSNLLRAQEIDRVIDRALGADETGDALAKAYLALVEMDDLPLVDVFERRGVARVQAEGSEVQVMRLGVEVDAQQEARLPEPAILALDTIDFLGDAAQVVDSVLVDMEGEHFLTNGSTSLDLAPTLLGDELAGLEVTE